MVNPILIQHLVTQEFSHLNTLQFFKIFGIIHQSINVIHEDSNYFVVISEKRRGHANLKGGETLLVLSLELKQNYEVKNVR